jgi:hypothetical protein
MLYVRSRGAVRIASGYALTGDGLWRQHSWGVDAADGRVIETTVRRVRYYGVILGDDDESLEFFFSNATVTPESFSPEEWEFLRGRWGNAALRWFAREDPKGR